MGKMNSTFIFQHISNILCNIHMICFVVLLVCFLAWGGGGGGVGGGRWGNGFGQSITFNKEGIFTSCTNEMNILWYNLYKGRSD